MTYYYIVGVCIVIGVIYKTKKDKKKKFQRIQEKSIIFLIEVINVKTTHLHDRAMRIILIFLYNLIQPI